MSSFSAASAYEPSLTLVRLRACACGARHPHAFNPPLRQDTCPDCGAEAAMPDSERTVRAVLAGRSPAALTSRALLAVGRFLHRLAERI